MLFKSGEETEANKLKSETSNLKLISKDLQEQIQKADANLISLRIQIPNIPEDTDS